MSKKFVYILLLFIVVLFVVQFNFIMSESKKSVNESITQTTQSGNKTVTQLFINGIYPSISNILKLKENPNPEVGLDGDDLEVVDNVIRKFVYGTDILKIKLYSLNGMTVYSTQLSQIGENKSQNSSFIEAKNGKAGSQITHRGKFSAVEKEVFEKDLVASYLPIKDSQGFIIGVAEIYTDRTPAILNAQSEESEIRAYMLLFNVLIGICIFFSFWILISKEEER